MPRLKRNPRHKKVWTTIAAASDWFLYGYLLTGRMERSRIEGDRLKFWEEHRQEILAAALEQTRVEGVVGRRPYPYWDELEVEHPRLVVGRERWLGPQTGPEPRKWRVEIIYEDDTEYLNRLGLLEPWEVEILDKQKAKKSRQKKI